MTKLYNELADWWPLMSAPADYAEEAAFYFDAMTKLPRLRSRRCWNWELAAGTTHRT